MAIAKSGSTKLAEPATIVSLRDEWLRKLHKLIVRVEQCAEELDWATKKIHKDMEDSEIGNYIAPALLLQHETVRLFLEPVTRLAAGTEGVVDLYRMPYYDDIASLYLKGSRWYVEYLPTERPSSDRIAEAKPEQLTDTNLKKLLGGMKAHAA